MADIFFLYFHNSISSASSIKFLSVKDTFFQHQSSWSVPVEKKFETEKESYTIWRVPNFCQDRVFEMPVNTLKQNTVPSDYRHSQQVKGIENTFKNGYDLTFDSKSRNRLIFFGPI